MPAAVQIRVYTTRCGRADRARVSEFGVGSDAQVEQGADADADDLVHDKEKQRG